MPRSPCPSSEGAYAPGNIPRPDARPEKEVRDAIRPYLLRGSGLRLADICGRSYQGADIDTCKYKH